MDIITIVLLLFLFLLLIFITILLAIFIFSVFLGAPYVPTPRFKIKRILKLAELKRGEVLYDLGSGDGQIIIEAAKNYVVKAIGVEINPFLVYFSRKKIRKVGMEGKIKVCFGSIFKKDISDANVIIIYLTQLANNRLEKKLLSELKPGTRIISLSFIFKKIPLVKSHHNIRLYQIPRGIK